MKTQYVNPSTLTPRPDNDLTSKTFLITHWLGLYESYLFTNAKFSTYERYSRILGKFYDHFPDKRFTYSFLRCDSEDYKQARLKEGASRQTVQMELSVLRGFFKWMLAMGADGCFFNPALGVRVPKEKRLKNQVEWHEE